MKKKHYQVTNRGSSTISFAGRQVFTIPKECKDIDMFLPDTKEMAQRLARLRRKYPALKIVEVTEAVEPEAVEPEAVEPEAVEPEAVEPEAVAETAEPEAVSQEAEVAEAVEPQKAEAATAKKPAKGKDKTE